MIFGGLIIFITLLLRSTARVSRSAKSSFQGRLTLTPSFGCSNCIAIAAALFRVESGNEGLR
jgi:hypothetical protein